MYILIDNYDSFTYNLFQYISEITDKEIKVFRNDAIKKAAELIKFKPEAIIISPGPGRPPEDVGVSLEVVKQFAGKIPILGVCLGHQVIAYAYGANIIQAKHIVHGKVEDIQLDGKGLFRNIPSPACFTRYHSLAVEAESLPDDFEITARAPDGEIMGIRHKNYILEGIQFHPESIASEYGKRLLKNFLNYKREPFKVREMLARIIDKQSMTFSEAECFMDEVTEGNLSDSQLAGFLIAINAKGFTPEEIAGCASILKKKRNVVTTSHPVLDTCGTGGDGLGTFNISSLSALIASACGAYVAKHGNRAVSSKSGSADFYKEMGININLNPQEATSLLNETGFTFLFAPIYHKAMKHAVSVRRELRIKTIFNLIGPLSNPASAEYQLIGVFSEDLCQPMAKAARLLGVKRVMVVHSMDGMDEISVSAPTKIVEIGEDDNVKSYIFEPEEIGIKLFSSCELKGGDAKKNMKIANEIISGNNNSAIKEAVLLNAGAALYTAGIASNIKDGYTMAKDALDKGIVKEKIANIIEKSRKPV